MPTLNASSSALRDRLAAEEERRSGPASCPRRPASPGTASRASRRPARAARCGSTRARRTPRGRSRAVAIRKHPRDRLRQHHADAAKRRRSPRIAKPCRTRAPELLDADAAPRRSRRSPRRGEEAESRSASPARAAGRTSSRRSGCASRPGASAARRSTSAQIDQRAGDDEVEERLDDQRRRERRVASSLRCGA